MYKLKFKKKKKKKKKKTMGKLRLVVVQGAPLERHSGTLSKSTATPDHDFMQDALRHFDMMLYFANL